MENIGNQVGGLFTLADRLSGANSSPHQSQNLATGRSYETIVQATIGEPETVEEVLRHYSNKDTTF